jgi:hypothetical protein
MLTVFEAGNVATQVRRYVHMFKALSIEEECDKNVSDKEVDD